MTAGTAVALRDDAPLTVPEIAAQIQLLQEALGTVMIEGVHYGQLEDETTGEQRLKKPILYKAGSEKLLQLFKLRPRYEELGGVHQQGFIAYRHRCVLVHYPSGLEVGEGLGSCNSRERKYKWAKDPWDLDNTLLKMSCKRALASAVLAATAASDIFDQAEGPVTTPQHRKLAILVRRLEENHPQDGSSWEDWTRMRAHEIAGVESRAELNAEEMAELIAATEAILADLEKTSAGTDPPGARADGDTRSPSESPSVAPIREIDGSDPEAVIVDFGNKHRDEALADIEAHDPGYVDWLARSARNDTVRAAAAAIVANRTGGGTT